LSRVHEQAQVDPEDLEFFRLYGPWEPTTPEQAMSLLDGFDPEWWVVGGWALEAFTGLPRAHEDIDVGFFRRDLPALRRHFAGRYDLWSNSGGVLRPITDRWPDLQPDSEQVWLRQHAMAPWCMDLLANPDVHGRWVFRRDDAITADLNSVTWLKDGVRFSSPEVVLAFKALHDRPKDRADLDAALPLMQTGQRNWLRDTVARLHPGHRWLDRI
jgi:hypothetical protein